MKRIAVALSAALVLVVVSCDNPNGPEPNGQDIKGVKPDNAPTQQGKNSGTLKERPEGATPGGGMPGGGGPPGGGGGGMAKKGGQAFPNQPGPIRPDQIPGDYPRGEGKATLKDGTKVDVKGQAPAGGDAKPEGDDAKSAALTDEEKANIAKLSEAEQALALAQAVCLISGEHLGSMGTPVKVEHEGKTAFLCCKGCTAEFKADPEKAMAKLTK